MVADVGDLVEVDRSSSSARAATASARIGAGQGLPAAGAAGRALAGAPRGQTRRRFGRGTGREPRPGPSGAGALPAFRDLRRLPAAASAGRALRRSGNARRCSTALARRGLHEIEVAPPLITPPASRRRVRLAFGSARAAAGCAARLSDALGSCPGRRRPSARSRAPRSSPCCRRSGSCCSQLGLARRGGEVQITAAMSGLDLLLITALAARPRRARGAGRVRRAQDLARLAWRRPADGQAEPIAARRAGAGRVRGRPRRAAARRVPAGDRLRRGRDPGAAVRGASATPRRIADLFAGLRHLRPAVRAPRGGRVLALDARSCDAGRGRKRGAPAPGSATGSRAERRDLERAPLAGPGARGAWTAVILDPPRAGARAQAAALARVARAADRHGVLQSRDLRARCPHPGRRRLAPGLGAADRCLPLVRTDRAGGRLRARGSRPPTRLICPSPPLHRSGPKRPRPLRLVAQDVALSRRKQGFESPRGRQAFSQVVTHCVQCLSNMLSQLPHMNSSPRATSRISPAGGALPR